MFQNPSSRIRLLSTSNFFVHSEQPWTFAILPSPFPTDSPTTARRPGSRKININEANVRATAVEVRLRCMRRCDEDDDNDGGHEYVAANHSPCRHAFPLAFPPQVTRERIAPPVFRVSRPSSAERLGDDS
ncbi:hypothetical protein CCHR01_14238 [Colletotrichum chrysophilum]|uniref:Uncharacterized protein n=1 Tax=Colletotrichum chrysophilum TaxID=1836956 RepID=A0AAD9A8J7_9PEZI|nr:hypothetical protein CCHR01_14238 [Colletotrichum chrysophilum]